MVLQVAADAWQVGLDRDLLRRSSSPAADTRKHEELRRVDHAAAQQHFAPGPGQHHLVPASILDADRARSLEDDAGRQCAGCHLEVGAPQGGTQIGGRGAAAPAVADRHLQTTESLLLRAVVVFGPAIAGALPSLGVGAEQTVLVTAELRRDRARTAAVGAGRALPAFLLDEVGQGVSVGPVGQPGRRPAVEIARIAAHESHGVGRGRPADHLAAGALDPAVVGARLGLGEIHPVVQPLLQDLPPAERDVNPRDPGPSRRPRAAGRTRRRFQSAALPTCSRQTRRQRSHSRTLDAS